MTSLNVVSYIEYSTLQHLYARVVIELRATAVDVGFSFENIVWKRAEVLTWFMSFVATATRDASMSLSLKQRCLKLMVDTCRNVPAIAACLDWLKVPHKTVRKTAALLYVFEKGNFTWTFIVFGSARYAGWRGRCSIFFFSEMLTNTYALLQETCWIFVKNCTRVNTLDCCSFFFFYCTPNWH